MGQYVPLFSKERVEDEGKLISESKPAVQKRASIMQRHCRGLEIASTHLIAPHDREKKDQNEVAKTKA